MPKLPSWNQKIFYSDSLTKLDHKSLLIISITSSSIRRVPYSSRLFGCSFEAPSFRSLFSRATAASLRSFFFRQDTVAASSLQYSVFLATLHQKQQQRKESCSPRLRCRLTSSHKWESRWRTKTHTLTSLYSHIATLAQAYSDLVFKLCASLASHCKSILLICSSKLEISYWFFSYHFLFPLWILYPKQAKNE